MTTKSNLKEISVTMEDRSRKEAFVGNSLSAETRERLTEVTEGAAGLGSPRETLETLHQRNELLRLEAVVGEPNFLPAWFLQIGADRARAVCRVKVTDENSGQEWSGTGFLVSENIVLTNNHVLGSSVHAESARCVFNYQDAPDGNLEPYRVYRLRPDRLFITSPSQGGLDFTFCWVDGEPGKQFGYVPLSRRPMTIPQKEFANIIQHPGGRPKAVVVQKNQVENQDPLIVHYTSDTEPGSSGAAVFNNEWTLMALHHASVAKNGGTLNEGIKLSAIAAELEQRGQSGPDREAAAAVLSLFTGTDSLMGFFGNLGRESADDIAQGQTAVERLVDTYRGEANDIDIGFWNVEWFNRRVQDNVDQVAQVIVAMNLDIWAFEETSPEATQKLVRHLKSQYKIDFACDFSEPNASSGKQTTTVIWNKRTVEGKRMDWPQEIDQWFNVHSLDFGNLNLEAVEGKVFDRYPGLFYFKSKNRNNQDDIDFYLVPLHLKAMAEGKKRRRMASKILAAAVGKMIDNGEDKDWVLGGDFNAALASADFKPLVDKRWVPLSADDENDGVFSYVKSPRSLIDHIFLSPNLSSTYGADDYFIVAADRRFPNYVNQISDHRPVLVRLSLLDRAAPETARGRMPEELSKRCTAADDIEQMQEEFPVSLLKRKLGMMSSTAQQTVRPQASSTRVEQSALD